MTFRSGKFSAVYINQMDGGAFLHTADRATALTTADVTVFNSPGDAKAFIPGVKDEQVHLQGFYDGAPLTGSNTSADSFLKSLVGAPLFPTTLFFDGPATVGRTGYLCQSIITNYTPTTPVAGVETIKVDLQGSGGGGPVMINRGVCLTDGTSVTAGASAVTYNVASFDGTASSANGGYANVHVIANTVSVTTTIKLQHSSDNTTWVDLVTQTAATATLGGWILPVTGTVNRYLRAQVSTPIGTGSITVVAAFARG